MIEEIGPEIYWVGRGCFRLMCGILPPAPSSLQRRSFSTGQFCGNIVKRDYLLGYELFKRMSPIMLRRLQAAREKMLSLHARMASLKPVM